MSAQHHVAVFGLSANPPTGLSGHAGIVQHVLPLVDELWVLPVFKHAFSSKSDLAPFEHRMRMCELGLVPAAAQGGACVRVLDTERCLHEAAGPNERIGSIDVLDALVAAHPDTRFSWVLGALQPGADTFADLRAGRWKESAAFLQRVHFLVTERAGAPPPDTSGLGSQVRVLRIPGLTDVSSSAVRAALKHGDAASLPEGALHPDVLRYAAAHGLYAAAA